MPVRALNTVLLPTFGFPARAITISPGSDLRAGVFVSMLCFPVEVRVNPNFTASAPSYLADRYFCGVFASECYDRAAN